MDLDELPELKPPGLLEVRPDNPATVGFPAMLPLEIAMRTATPRAICEAYGITSEEWNEIRINPVFRAEMVKAKEMLTKEGMSFKLKARMQSDELLKTSWRLIHDQMVPPNVRADLIKATVRWAGYDAPQAAGSDAGNGFSISINFNGEKRNQVIPSTAVNAQLIEGTEE